MARRAARACRGGATSPPRRWTRPAQSGWRPSTSRMLPGPFSRIGGRLSRGLSRNTTTPEAAAESPSVSSRKTMRFIFAAFCLSIAGCGTSDKPIPAAHAGQFDSDVEFLRQHANIVLLGEPAAAQVVVSPSYQGRVMTSTTGGDAAPSFGWIGRAAIASGARQPHMNVFGGEDRFWLGPEGGQYSLFFKPGDPFDLDHWQVPEAFDWGPWDVESQTAASVRFRKRMTLVNYSGAKLDIGVDRTVRLLAGADVATQLGQPLGGVMRAVAFESSNTVTNAGAAPWQP